MEEKKVYESIEIVPFVTVAGNIRDLIQGYSIKYYFKKYDYPEKMALCIHLKKPELPEEKQPMPRYLFISSAEQLKDLIFDITKSYFYFRDKKASPDNLQQFRLVNLDDFLVKLKANQRSIWRKGTY